MANSTQGTPAATVSKTTDAKPIERSGSLTSSDADMKSPTMPNDAAKPPEANDEPEYPPTKERIVVMIAILLAIFLIALDRTIIATAIPKMTDEFHSLDDIGWYGSAFMLTTCCFQLLLGRVYTFYTPKYIFLIMIVVFEIGSAVCGAAPSSIAVIIGRAIQGIGAAGIMAGGIILMVNTIPLDVRPKWMGLFGATFGVASVVGPLIGNSSSPDLLPVADSEQAVHSRRTRLGDGVFTSPVNLPIGGIVLAIILFILKPNPPLQGGLTIRQQVAKLDLLGELCLLPSVICLLLALQWGGSSYRWNDPVEIALFVLFAVLAIGFVLVQIFMPKTATLPGRVMNNQSILAGMFLTVCIGSAMLSFTYFLPIWFQAIKGTSAVQSGINTIPMVLALVVGNIGSGQITGRIGYYTSQAYASVVIMPIGAGLITTFKPTTSSSAWIGYQVLFGVGVGLGMQQGNMAAQTVLARKDVPIGVSLMMLWQNLGGAVFISVSQNIFNSHLVSSLVKQNIGLNPEQILNTGATSLRSAVPADNLPALLIIYNSAVRQVFVLGTILSCLAVLGAAGLEWRSVKGKQGPGGGKAAPAPEKISEDVVSERV
ncbi:hypothetical protein LTR56_006830 [Elasticomyces elasticus]|nr:hypothetical protein LTR56_006830 [Elasticomyces elasticus]KAK3659516.1 hypothetical protein LTR22_008433 [Elasticomyces elasticus]KAK4923244.1 hypothetical protein LTR49_009507 [Elasticomyces elasticus]KAK5757653.1 hypothetical protein LTS12_012255 [Elasticomyces elasticus]